jgi:hypothetical protein
MNKWILPILLLAVTASTVAPLRAIAEEDFLAVEEAASESIKNHPEWISALKTRHHLSDEHIQWMRGKGLSYPQMVIASILSEKSGKTVDDILEMRSLSRKGWKKVAQDLGLIPVEIGRSVTSLRQEVQQEMQLNQENKNEAKNERIKTKEWPGKRG